MRRIQSFFWLVLLTLYAAAPVAAQERDDLQEFINRQSALTRAASAETVVDLSKFDAVNRTATLVVGNGNNYRFINGTLTRMKSLDGPLVKVSGDSRVVVGAGATFNGGGLMTNTTKHAVVEVDGGVLSVESNGTITSGISTATTPGTKYARGETSSIVVVPVLTPCVSLVSAGGSRFFLNGGAVLNDIKDEYSNDSNYEQTNSIWLHAGSVGGNVITGGRLEYYSETVLKGKIDLTSTKAYIHLHSALKSDLQVSCYVGTGIQSATYSRLIMDSSPAVIQGKGANVDYPTSAAYTVKQSDVDRLKVRYYGNNIDNIHVSDGYRWGDGFLTLEKTSVYLRLVDTSQKAVTDANSLQQALDDIAKRGQSSEKAPETIEIPSGGITLDRTIYVRNGCHAVITGGRLTAASVFSGNSLFEVQTGLSLKFEKIAINLNYVMFEKGAFRSGGILTFGQGFSLSGVSGVYDLIVTSGGIVNIESGEFNATKRVVYAEGASNVFVYGGLLQATTTSAYGSGTWAVIEGQASVLMVGGRMVGSSSAHYTVNITGEGIFNGGTVTAGAGNILVHTEAMTTYNGGTITGGSETHLSYGFINATTTINVPTTVVYHDAVIDGAAKMQQTTLRLPADGVVRVTKSIAAQWTVTAQWERLKLNTPLMEGFKGSQEGYTYNYIMTEADFKRMAFKDVPSGYEVYYNATDKAVELRKKSDDPGTDDPGTGAADADDLQDYIDGLDPGDRGTEEKPVRLPIQPEVDVDDHVYFDDLQAYIDGDESVTTQDDDPDKRKLPRLIFRPEGGCLHVMPVAGLAVRNVKFDGNQTAHHVNVYGKLEVGINTVVKNFSRYFAWVRPGGRLVWRGGTGTVDGYVVYNDGGTVEWRAVGSVRGKAGTIKSSGTVYIDGGSRLTDISINHSAQLYLTSRLQTTLNINFYETAGLRDGLVLMRGSGYRPTSSDYANMYFVLPMGYTTEFNATEGTVVLRSNGTQGTTFIENVQTSNGGYATFYDSQLAFQLPEGMKAYVVTAVSGGRLQYQQVADGSTASNVVPSGVAVVLRASATASAFYNLRSTTQAASYDGPNLLQGTDVATTISSSTANYYYKLSMGRTRTQNATTVGWYWGATNGGGFAVQPHRAWLVVPRSAAARADGFALFDDVTLGVGGVTGGDAQPSAGVYDVSGRRQSLPADRLPAGVYISGGKKFVRK